MGARTVRVDWEIDESMVANILAGLAAHRTTDIHVEINSPGGEVFPGLQLYRALQNHPASVDVTITGLAAGMAGIVALAGDDIAMLSSALFGMLSPRSWIPVTTRSSSALVSPSTATDRGGVLGSNMLMVLADTREFLSTIYAEKSGQPASTMLDAMIAETWYTAPQCVGLGFADRMVE